MRAAFPFAHWKLKHLCMGVKEIYAVFSPVFIVFRSGGSGAESAAMRHADGESHAHAARSHGTHGLRLCGGVVPAESALAGYGEVCGCVGGRMFVSVCGVGVGVGLPRNPAR